LVSLVTLATTDTSGTKGTSKLRGGEVKTYILKKPSITNATSNIYRSNQISMVRRFTV
jgi:hypothetical protein